MFDLENNQITNFSFHYDERGQRH